MHQIAVIFFVLFDWLTLYVLKFSEGTKHIFIFHVIPLHWHDTHSWNHSSSKARTYLCYIVKLCWTKLTQSPHIKHKLNMSFHLTFLNPKTKSHQANLFVYVLCNSQAHAICQYMSLASHMKQASCCAMNGMFACLVLCDEKSLDLLLIKCFYIHMYCMYLSQSYVAIVFIQTYSSVYCLWN